MNRIQMESEQFDFFFLNRTIYFILYSPPFLKIHYNPIDFYRNPLIIISIKYSNSYNNKSTIQIPYKVNYFIIYQ